MSAMLQGLDELPPATSADAHQGTMAQMAVVESVGVLVKVR